MRLYPLLFVTAAAAVACSDPISNAAGPRLVGTDSALATSVGDLDAPHYTGKLLPRLPGETWSVALGINAAGVAVGASSMPLVIKYPDAEPFSCSVMTAVVFRAFDAVSLYSALERAMGGGLPCEIQSVATDINDRDEVVGTVWRGNDWASQQGFYWTPKSGVVLHSAPGGFWLTGMNNNGVTVGYRDIDGFNTKGLVLWSPTSTLASPVVPWAREIYPWDINNDGTIAGCINQMAYKMDPSGALVTNEEWCGHPTSQWGWYPSFRPSPGGINRYGVAAYSASGDVPVTWGANRNRGIPVGWSPGAATGISDRGRVVGWKTFTTAPLSVGMTVARGGRLLPLPGLPAGSASEAYAVNTCGHIAGATFDSNGLPHAMQWKTSRCDIP